MADEQPQKSFTDAAVSRRNFLRISAAAGVAAVTPFARADEKRPLTDEQLLDITERETLKYFTDFAHPVSGMARECTDPNSKQGLNTVTTGGTGFGIMGIVAGASRGWIPRREAVGRVAKIANFLDKAQNYHGVYPHWLDGTTGKTYIYPGSKDDGADLVETSYLMMGLLTARQYFNGNTPDEMLLREKINELSDRVNWKWHSKNGEAKELYWHWSPTQEEWKMKLPISGWNEALVTHVLAAGSKPHGVDADIYHESWAKGQDFKNGHAYNGITLPLGPKGGGPLFMSQYSFMGLNPKGLKDKYADYWQQNVNHTLVNRAHCIENPHGYKGYGAQCWGLTSSENDTGYSDHSPTNDRGVIAPTAALSAMPYTPEYSMEVLRHLVENHPHDKIMGKYGFVDAFKPDGSWYSPNHLAIDQGPTVVMIENHRSGLLWDLFMSCPEVSDGMEKLGFESPHMAKAAANRPVSRPSVSR